MKPKVLIIIDTAIIGGPGKGLFQFLKQANQAEFEYVLCNFRYKKPKSEEFINQARELGIPLALFSQNFRFDPSPFWQAAKLLRDSNCNLIQTHGYKGHLIALVLSRMFNIPWIAFQHGWTSEDWKIKLYQRLEIWAVKSAHRAVTVSPQLFKTISQIRGTKRPTSLIFNAVDPSEVKGHLGGQELRRQLQFSAEDFVIGCFGRLSPEKGQAFLIQAIAEIIKIHPQIQLLLVGDGPEKEKLKILCQALQISNRVNFVGHQTNMRDYYEASNLMVLPSLSEGLPNVLLEAMSLGLPAIATNVGAVSEVIQTGVNGWIVEPRNCTQITALINLVINQPDLLSQVATQAKSSLSPKFDASSRAEAILNIYKDVLS